MDPNIDKKEYQNAAQSEVENLSESADAKEPSNKKTRKLGRAARRRKAKSRSIDLVLQALLNGEDEIEQQKQLPTDRSESLPGVLQRRQENQVVFDIDEPILVSQLGYMPGNAIGVVGRLEHLRALYPTLYKLLIEVDSKRYAKNNINVEKCGANETKIESSPTALKLYPLALRKLFKGGKSGRKFKSRKRGHQKISQENDTFKTTEEANQESEGNSDNGGRNGENTNEEIIITEPFPTMYWLTHPLLRTLISQLELGSSNNVSQVEEKLASSPQHLSIMKTAHESYGRQRWELLTEEDKQDVIIRKWTDAVGGVRGVAGIRKHETVKCLHTHAAHYLAFLGQNYNEQDLKSTKIIEENLVGKWTLEEIENSLQENSNDKH